MGYDLLLHLLMLIWMLLKQRLVMEVNSKKKNYIDSIKKISKLTINDLIVTY